MFKTETLEIQHHKHKEIIVMVIFLEVCTCKIDQTVLYLILIRKKTTFEILECLKKILKVISIVMQEMIHNLFSLKMKIVIQKLEITIINTANLMIELT